jgi:hypothetical protein
MKRSAKLIILIYGEPGCSYGLQTGLPGQGTRQQQRTFLLIASIPALGCNELPIKWVPGALSFKVWPGREADHSASSAEVKNGGGMPLFPDTSS